MFFETDRLFTRELNLGDTSLFVEMQSNANVMKHITGKPKSKEESIKELEKIINGYIKNKEFLIMAVVKKDKSNFIGTCAVIRNDDEEYEIGYRIIEEYWSKGYGKEIVNGLVEFAFHVLNLEQIVAHVNKNNYKSIKILENSNFSFMREYIESGTGYIVRYYKISKRE